MKATEQYFALGLFILVDNTNLPLRQWMKYNFSGDHSIESCSTVLYCGAVCFFYLWVHFVVMLDLPCGCLTCAMLKVKVWHQIF